MQKVIGFLTCVDNPNFSGIATVHIRSRKFPIPRDVPDPDMAPYSRFDIGELTKCYVDAGSGVRWLSRIFDGFSSEGQHTEAEFTIDDMGMLSYITLVGEEA